jgi:hypothetical protein
MESDNANREAGMPNILHPRAQIGSYCGNANLRHAGSRAKEGLHPTPSVGILIRHIEGAQGTGKNMGE